MSEPADTTAALDTSIEAVKGVGPKRGSVLREAGIHTVRDLLYHLPRRYLDRRQILPIAQVPTGREVTLIARVVRAHLLRGRRPRFTLQVEDETGRVTCVWFQGGRHMHRGFQEGDVLALSGTVEVYRGERQMAHPEYEFVGESGGQGLLHTGAIVPLYTTSADMKERGLRSRGFRRMVRAAVDAFSPLAQDPLPAEIRERQGLLGLQDSLGLVHFPGSMAEVAAARRRLAFEELFYLQVRLARRRRDRLERGDGIVCKPSERLVPALLQGLPFELTGAQHRVIGEISEDMERAAPMRRLLQGDVGSGKTLVALCAALNAVENGYQAAIMAPTEILAEQHFQKVSALAEPLGVTVALLVGKQRAALRRELRRAVELGAAAIAVGTHALIEDQVTFSELGLVVVDEQHRFGVAQRSALLGKERRADALVMTATPIPRTLSLSLYGDLEVSVLDELPPGRREVRTAVRGAARRERIFEFAAEQLRAGRQAYVVYPLIEESQKVDLTAAVSGFEELRQGQLAEFKVALLHGRLPAEEKAALMHDFKQGQIQALVATTVIEVGVDVPNATVMVVEHAERFGLAQLHQLRGRVGRGSAQSYCILVNHLDGGQEDSDAAQRLQTLVATQDGFAIAQKDLELRGPGEFFGARQAGVPEFAAADLVRDADLVELARDEAVRAVSSCAR